MKNIRDLDIFFLLGIDDGDLSQKKKFLADLQQDIWDNFILDDCPKYLDEKTCEKIQKINKDDSLSDLKKQISILKILNQHLSSLEDIFKQKAIDLKKSLFFMRIESLLKLYTGTDKYEKVEKALNLAKQGDFEKSATLLNKYF